MNILRFANFPPIIMITNILGQLQNLFEILLQLTRRAEYRKPHMLIKLLHGYRSTVNQEDVWENLEQNWDDFFWLTGETPESLRQLVLRVENQFRRRLGRTPILSFRNQILLTMIWLRRYPTMYHLAMNFSISVSSVCKTIHSILPMLHVILVPKYINWHNMNKWRGLAGTYPEWPRVVAILDCTPFRICRPLVGNLQRVFWRRDRKQFFLNWIVIVDVDGYIVYSRPGFVGHLHDSTCLRHVQLPVLPAGLQIMADQGFANRAPLLVAPRRNQFFIPHNMRRSFRRYRSFIERCFGMMKSAYSSVSSRYRGRRWSGPLVCNVCAALYNRRRQLLLNIRQNT